MSFAIKEEALFAAEEVTYGTAVTAVATDALEVENLQPNPAESARIIERNIVRASLSPQPHQYGGSLFGFTFDAELKGGGSLGVAPRVGRLLKACGLKETIVASTSVTYEPESDLSLHDSVTLTFKEGPNLRVIAGCRGNFSLSIDAAQRIMGSFTFIGKIDSEAEAAAPASTIETTLPPVFRGANFVANAIATPIGNFSVDLSNTMAIAPNPNDSEGFGDIRISARALQGSFDPEAQAIGTQDLIGDFRAATEFAVNTGVLGSTAGNRVAISMPRCQYVNPAPGDREALRTYEMSFRAVDTVTGDDDIAIQFT